MEQQILVDGQKTTLREFIHANTEQEGQIELSELLALLNAKTGDSIAIGIIDIKIL